MKTLNELIITKSQFFIIDPKIIINNLILQDLKDYNDPFILENKDYILNKPISKFWFYLIRDFKSSLNQKEIDKILKLIATNSDYSLLYAYHLKDRFKEGEVSISMNGNHATNYAVKILKKRWTETPEIDIAVAYTAEYNIAKNDPYNYAKKVLKKAWRDVEEMDPSTANLAEDFIIKKINLHDAVDYAISLMKRRWPELEKKILKASYDFEGLHLYIEYIKTFINKRLPEFEDVLLNFKDIQLMAHYAAEIINDRWIEAETEILRQMNILNANFHSVDDDEDEDDYEDGDLNDLTILDPYIYDDIEVLERKIFETIDLYSYKVIKGPWPEAGID